VNIYRFIDDVIVEAKEHVVFGESHIAIVDPQPLVL
jgi:hypothetical protein